MIRSLIKTQEVILYEVSPSEHTVSIDGRRHFLQFPYMVMGIAKFNNKEHDSHQFVALASQKPVRTPKDEVFTLPLPNSYSTGVVCLNLEIPTSKFTNEWAKQYIELYWNAPFKTGGVSYGDKHWLIAQEDYWKPYNKRPQWHMPTNPLAHYINTPLPNVFDPNFTDKIIGERAAELKAEYWWNDDVDCWLEAENTILQKLYKEEKRSRKPSSYVWA